MDYNYHCLKHKSISKENYSLETVKPDHIEYLRIWRNEKIDILRQTSVIQKEEQIKVVEDDNKLF